MTALPLHVDRTKEAPLEAPAGSGSRAVPEDEMPPVWVLLLLPAALVVVGAWAICRRVVRW